MNTEKRPVLCITLYRKPMQPCNFDGILYQLRHWIFSDGFHQKISFKGSVERSSLPWAIFLIFTRNRPCLKITSARCFLLKCQRKVSKKAKEHRQFRGVLGRWRTAAIDRTTFHACQRCRKASVFAVFSRLWGVICRGKAFCDQQCQFLTRNKSLSSENESNCSMTSECVRTDSILPRGAGVAAWEFAALQFQRAYNPRVPSAGELPRWRANFQVSASTRVGVPISVSALNTRTQSDCACRDHGQVCLDRRILLVSQTVVWIHPTLYLKWMPRREWRNTNQMGFLDRREACRSVFKLDYHQLTKIPQNLMRVEKGLMVLSLVPEPTRRNIWHLKDYPVFQVFFFDFRTLAVSCSTRYASYSAQRAELHNSCTACARVEFSKARAARYEPQKRAYLDTNELLRGRTNTVRIGYRVTGYNDLPDIMIGLTKIKIKTSKRHSKYHYIQCISAVVIYRI